MNDTTSGTPMLTESTSTNQPEGMARDESGLEQQMADLGLSKDLRWFLRNLHLAEKQLNAAFSKSRQGGDLEDRVSEVYRDLYGTGCAVRAAR